MAGFITRRMELVQAFQEATGTDVTEVLEVIGRQTVKKVSITTIEGQEAEPPLVIDSANDVGQGMLIAVIEYASEHDWPEIIDHGEGVPEQIREQIFQRFWRADTSRTRETGGSGLGLSIVAAIARMHGGHPFAGSEGGCTSIGLIIPAS